MSFPAKKTPRLTGPAKKELERTALSLTANCVVGQEQREQAHGELDQVRGIWCREETQKGVSISLIEDGRTRLSSGLRPGDEEHALRLGFEPARDNTQGGG